MTAFITIPIYIPTNHINTSRSFTSITNTFRISLKYKHKSPKQCRPSLLMVIPDNNNQSDKQNIHDNDADHSRSKTAFRDFGKICLAATGIGVILFFYDILACLFAMTIGVVYAVSVLFEVKGANTLISRTLASSKKLGMRLALRIRDAWRFLRREVRKGLED